MEKAFQIAGTEPRFAAKDFAVLVGHERHLPLRSEIVQGRGTFNIDRVDAKMYILLGGVVGACVAIAFSLALWFQFEAAGTEVVILASLPICTLMGALFGWVWWRWVAR